MKLFSRGVPPSGGALRAPDHALAAMVRTLTTTGLLDIPDPCKRGCVYELQVLADGELHVVYRNGPIAHEICVNGYYRGGCPCPVCRQTYAQVDVDAAAVIAAICAGFPVKKIRSGALMPEAV